MYESEKLWRDVDEYFVRELCPEDDALTAARTSSRDAGLPDHEVADRIDLLPGPATESSAGLVRDGVEPYDLVFIDADKANNLAYLEAALALTRPGSVIVGDNVVRNGAVVDPASEDPRVRGSCSLIEAIGRDDRLDATALQTVGSKGWDGFVLARVR